MNFALILLVLTVVTGILYAIDILKFRKLRAANDKQPLWVEWGADFFPGDPDRLRAPFLPVRAVQDSLGLDDSDPAGG